MSDVKIITYDSQKKTVLPNAPFMMMLELFHYRFVLYNLVSSTLKARYRRSVFGFLWSLLNPLFTLLILAIVFSTLYSTRFADFGLYLLSGLLPWIMISNTLMGGSSSLVLAEGYLKKIYLPKQIFPTSVLGVEIINFLLSLISLMALAIVFGATPNLLWLLLPVVLVILSIFLFGIVLSISILTIYFRDFSHILQVGLTGLFYMTPIVYPLEFIKDSILLEIIKFNPFFYFISMFHSIIKDSTIPSLETWLICLVLSVLSYIIGVFIFRVKESDIVYRL